jgi:hypothetical protein
MTPAQIAARRKGGYSTQRKYDAETKRKWCSSGGRPHNLNIDELRALQSGSNINDQRRMTN